MKLKEWLTEKVELGTWEMITLYICVIILLYLTIDTFV